MADRSGRWVVTYNGEIYNHNDLRRSLPGPFRGSSDTETLVTALAAWGDDAIDRCNGIFGFAAYDADRERVLLARDHLGIKPLYVVSMRGGLWFASEIKALLAAGAARRERREARGELPFAMWLEGRETPFDGIERVLPGTIVEIDVRTLERGERTWYSPASAVDADRSAELAAADEGRLTETLTELLRDSVRRQLMSDAKVGVMLSGGLDSSVIAALASEESPGIVMYNASMSDDRDDESPWAEAVARELGADIRVVPMAIDDWRAALVPAVMHFEYPMFLGAVPIASIGRAAHDDGVKVLLTGEGADELFGGYAFHHWRQTSMLLPAYKRLRLAMDYVVSDGRWLPDRLRGRRRVDPFNGLMRPPETNPRERFREDVRRDAAVAYAHHDRHRRDVEVALLGDLFFGSMPRLLNRQDKNLMATSVEARVPYLDLEVLEFGLNLPVEYRVGPRPKRILRGVAQRVLPSIARRPKKLSMNVQFGRYLESATRASFVQDGVMRGLLELPAGMWRASLAQLTDGQRFSMCSSEIWARLFLCDQSVATVEADLWV
jgi:asparagine synthase (glutamine-hydrolysing)